MEKRGEAKRSSSALQKVSETSARSKNSAERVRLPRNKSVRPEKDLATKGLLGYTSDPEEDFRSP